MPSITPATYFGGFQLLAAAEPAPDQGIFIPLADLPGLTAQEADAANGDIRKFIYELNRTVFAALNNMDAVDQPTRFDVTRGTPIGIDSTTVRQSYTSTFDLDISGVDVASEPVNPL